MDFLAVFPSNRLETRANRALLISPGNRKYLRLSKDVLEKNNFLIINFLNSHLISNVRVQHKEGVD